MTHKIVILYSGGLDSLIMKRFAEVNYPNADVVCVWYDIGQEYARKEEAVLPDFVIKHKFDWLDSQTTAASKDGSASGNIYIPGRNMVLATAVACKYLPDEVWLGALAGETHEQATDKNYDFLKYLNRTLSYVLSPFTTSIKARFPLAGAGFNKLRAVKWAVENGVSHEAILKSSSCLSGEAGNCGQCIVCFRRWGIFKQLGIPAEKYNIHPLEAHANREVIEEMMFGTHYDDERKSEVMPAVPEEIKDEVRKIHNIKQLRRPLNETS